MHRNSSHNLQSQVYEKSVKLRCSTAKAPTCAFHELSQDMAKWLPFFLVEIKTANKQSYRALVYLEFVVCLQYACSVYNCHYKFLKEDRFASIKI